MHLYSTRGIEKGVNGQKGGYYDELNVDESKIVVSHIDALVDKKKTKDDLSSALQLTH